MGARAEGVSRRRLPLWHDRSKIFADRAVITLAHRGAGVATQRLPFLHRLNSATLLKRGVPLKKVEALSGWRDSALFDERERAALEFAEAVTLRSEAIEAGASERLQPLFDMDAIVELTALIAFQNLSSKFNAALGVPPQGFCRIGPA